MTGEGETGVGLVALRIVVPVRIDGGWIGVNGHLSDGEWMMKEDSDRRR